MFNIEELTEEQLEALQKEIETEVRRRHLPDFDISELTSQQLDELRIKVKKRIEKGMFLDFHHHRISSQNWSQVMDALKEKERSLMERSRPLSIRLGENYLQNSEAKELCQYILESKVLKKNLVLLELNNNEIRSGALPLMRKVLEECPNLNLLNADINYINHDQFEKIFAKVPPELLEKIRCNAY
jgi:hypothetical protein